MEESDKNIGYEVTVEHQEENRVYCVDNKRSIRGWYVDGFRHYLSDFELWAEQDSGKRMGGELKEGEIVSIVSEEETKCVKIIRIGKVRISEKTKDPYIAGVHRPIYKPGILS